MLRSLSDGVRVGLTVTVLDGLVLARSAYHHSMLPFHTEVGPLLADPRSGSGIPVSTSISQYRRPGGQST